MSWGHPRSTGFAAGPVVERGRGPLGAGVDAPGLWVSAQSVVLWGDCPAVGYLVVAYFIAPMIIRFGSLQRVSAGADSALH